MEADAPDFAGIEASGPADGTNSAEQLAPTGSKGDLDAAGDVHGEAHEDHDRAEDEGAHHNPAHDHGGEGHRTFAREPRGRPTRRRAAAGADRFVQQTRDDEADDGIPEEETDEKERSAAE
jgi:hypothetical protein